MINTRFTNLIWLHCLLLAACAGKKTEQVTTTYSNGKPAKIITYLGNDSTQVTSEKYLYEEGQTKAEGALENKKRNGTWYSYYKDGKPWSMHTYKNGMLNGPYKTWHENGQLSQDGQLENDVPTGVWKFYDETGKLVRENDCALNPLPWNSSY